MFNRSQSRVAIVDYGMGNLFSVKHACESVGLSAVITCSQQEICSADAVILPGVGAYGDAMQTLRRLDLVTVLQHVAASGKPFMGICLGTQLLMTESFEFGRHTGLGIIQGQVVPFDHPVHATGEVLKVPQIGWNRIHGAPSSGPPANTERTRTDFWTHSLLNGLAHGEHMYFVHSYYVQPETPEVVLSISRYGNITFCSSLGFKNIFACQFHPERSGPQGLQIYRNLASMVYDTTEP